MPLTTSTARRSSVGLLSPWQVAPPSPTDSPGTVDTADRAHSAHLYSGLEPIYEEFLGPFATWANVKTDYGAVGNGTTDDTTAFQNAFNDLGQAGEAAILWVPAGTYRITATLTLHGRIYIGVYGEDPATTTLVWDGAAAGTLWSMNGTRYSQFGRMTLDGNGTAAILVDQNWDGSTLSGKNFDTSNLYADMVFQDATRLLRGGFGGNGFAEISVHRCQFYRGSYGITLGNPNALDVWVWDCLFEDCDHGVSNIEASGNYQVYRSVFRGSTSVDMDVFFTGQFTARGCTSTGSNQFFRAGGITAACNIILQDNVILDTVLDEAIDINNRGPVFLLDNTIRSLATATAPIVKQGQGSDGDLVALGNTFTVASPISVQGRLVDYSTTIVSRTSLLGLTEPLLPPVPPRLGRTIYEVPAGATQATLESTIATALESGGTRPIVHLANGSFTITSTLRFPAGIDLQLCGDGFATGLNWTGAGSGPLLLALGPTHLRVYGLKLDSHGMRVQGIDQVGARVFLDRCQLRFATSRHLWLDGLNHALVEARDFVHGNMSTGTSILVEGGPSLTTSRLNIFAAGTSSNALSYRVTGGGKLLVREAWYETNSGYAFLDLGDTSGEVCLTGGRIALQRNGTPPAIDIDNWSGQAALLFTKLDDRMVVAGDGTNADVLALGMNFNAASNLPAAPLVDTSSPAADVRLHNSRRTNDGGSGVAVANSGTLTQAFVEALVAPMRTQTLQRRSLTSDPTITDLRLELVLIEDAGIALHLQHDGLAASLLGTSTTPATTQTVLRALSTQASGVSTTPSVTIQMAGLRQLTATLAGVSATPNSLVTVARALSATLVGSSTTPSVTIQMAGVRQLTATLQATSVTPSVQIQTSRALDASVVGTSTTPAITIQLATVRPLTAALTGASTTPSAQVQTAHALTAALAGVSTTPPVTIQLAGLRQLTANLQGVSTTPAAVSTTLHSLSATLSGASATPAAGSQVQRPLTATFVGISTTPTAARVQTRALAAALIGTSATLDAGRTLQRSLTAQITGTSTTPAVTIQMAGLRQLTASLVGTSTTPAIAHTMGRTLSAALVGSSTTPTTAVQTVRQLSANVVGTSTTPAATGTMGNLRSLTAALVGTSTTPTATHTLQRRLTAQVSGLSTTPAATVQIATLRNLTAVLAGASTTPAVTIQMAGIRNLTATLVGVSTTPAAGTSVLRPIAAAIEGSSVTSTFPLRLQRGLSAALGATSTTPSVAVIMGMHRPLTALVAGISTTPPIVVQVHRPLTATLAGTSTTPTAIMVVTALRLLSANLTASTQTPVSIGQVLRALTATLVGISTTSDVAILRPPETIIILPPTLTESKGHPVGLSSGRGSTVGLFSAKGKETTLV